METVNVDFRNMNRTITNSDISKTLTFLGRDNQLSHLTNKRLSHRNLTNVFLVQTMSVTLEETNLSLGCQITMEANHLREKEAAILDQNKSNYLFPRRNLNTL